MMARGGGRYRRRGVGVGNDYLTGSFQGQSANRVNAIVSSSSSPQALATSAHRRSSCPLVIGWVIYFDCVRISVEFVEAAHRIDPTVYSNRSREIVAARWEG